MSTSKRKRFEVLSRDGFKCVYCGATASEAKLVVDHLKPKSRQGSDGKENLVTACVDCNSGKSALLISDEQIEKIIKDICWKDVEEILNRVLPKKLHGYCLECGQTCQYCQCAWGRTIRVALNYEPNSPEWRNFTL